MAGETRLTAYKEALSRNLQCLQGTLATAWATSIVRVRQYSTRVLVWGSVGVAAARDSVKWGVAVLRRHTTGLKVSLIGGVGVIIILACVVLLVKIPQWQVAGATLSDDKVRIELQDKIRGTLAQSIGTIAQIIGGMALLVGLYFTGRSAAAAWRTVQVNEEGQITERFTRAIEQLGSDKLAIRLGGIYALERIAHDSPKDHWPIMEVLTAYVREHALCKDTPQPQEGTTPALEAPTEPKPAADIQAILTVLRRRRRWYRQGEPQPLDLRKTDLTGADLRGAHLEHTDLEGANLSRANLLKAHLEHAHLRDAHLEVADLLYADLRGADLRDACFWQANLIRADLRGADLLCTNLRSANLAHAELRGTNLPGTDLSRADLSGAHLERAFFSEAHLEGATLRGTHLEGANLLGAHDITKEQLDSAIIDEGTRLPAYLITEEAHGNNPTASG
jgi:uncharacterized protein YjbI with pentapeptide repeats